MFSKGLPVLFYLDLPALLKIRNVSSPMRKRAYYILKQKRLFINKNEEKVAETLDMPVFNAKDKIKIEKSSDEIVLRKLEESCPNQLLASSLGIKGMTNYFPDGEMTSGFIDAADKFRFADIDEFDYNKFTAELFKCMTIGRVRLLTISSKDPNIVKNLNKIETVDKLCMQRQFNDLTGVRWLKRLEKLELRQIEIETPIEMPNLTEMQSTSNTKGMYNIKCPKLQVLELSGRTALSPETKQFRSLKTLKFDPENFNEAIPLMPSGLMTITKTNYEEQNIDIKALIKQCPNLITLNAEVDEGFDIADLQDSRIRSIQIKNSTRLKKESTLRLRGSFAITDQTYKIIKEHPEIIEKTNKFYIITYNFDLKYLPEGPKTMIFSHLILVKKKIIDKHLDLFKDYMIERIQVEDAESARKVLRTAIKVKEMCCDEQLEELKKEFEGTGCKFSFVSAYVEEEGICSLF